MSEKFVATVKIERVVAESAACVEHPRGCRCMKPTADRRVDTVVSIVVTAETVAQAIARAKAHLDAEAAA